MTAAKQGTPTPRTDAAICKRVHIPNVWGFKEHDRVEEYVSAESMRQLERELAARREGYVEVPREPTPKMRSGLARDLMMAFEMCERHTPRNIFLHLENCGREIPQWLRDEPEMQILDHAVSKGTRCAIIYKAMLAAAPEEK